MLKCNHYKQEMTLLGNGYKVICKYCGKEMRRKESNELDKVF